MVRKAASRTKLSKDDLARLTPAIRASRWMLERHRSERREAIRQYVGQHWAEDGAPERVPVNLLALFVRIIGRSLVAKNPRFLASTFNRAAKPAVSGIQSWGNREIERMKLDNTLRRVVIDALFSIGITKVALATPSDAAELAWGLKGGQPFAERIDLDDFCVDAHARDWSEVGIIGHRYRVPLDTVRDSSLYAARRKNLSESRDSPYNLEGDERAFKLGQGYRGFMEGSEFSPHVDLWELYLPRHRQIVTIEDDAVAGGSLADLEPLRVQNWLGPDSGPYHILGYGTVPGNLMPAAPIQNLIDLHMAANESYRKVMREVSRIKEITGVAGGAMEDGNRILQCDDGDIIRLDNPENVKQFVSGGQAMQQVMVIAAGMKDLFSSSAGNLEIMGGLSPQSKTAHQDAMLNQNSSETVADLQEQTVKHAAEVLKALAWYWHHHPTLDMVAPHSLPGLPDLQMTRSVKPQHRQQIPFEQLDLEIIPYSMRPETPESKVQQLNEIVQTVVVPLAQLLAQQGIQFDLNAYLDKIGHYMDLPDLGEMLTVREPMEGGAGGGGEPPGPASTKREYVRTSMPGRSQKSNDANMASMAAGIKPGGNPEQSMAA